MRWIALLLAATAVAMFLVLWASCSESTGIAPSDPPPHSNGSGGPPVVPVDPVKDPANGGNGTPKPPPERDPPEPAAIEPAAGAPVSDGEVSASELGSGPCTLVLRLIDETSGQPVSCGVRLWRLGVPGSGAWPAGDHVQRHVEIPAGGATLRRLPAGRYRVEADGARAGAPDGPEFLVESRTEVTVRVALPAPIAIRCAVYDEYGAMIRTARHRQAPGAWGAPRVRAAPGWASPRRKDGAAPAEVSWSSNLTRSDSGGDLSAGADGFEIGTLAATNRVFTFERADDLLFEGRSAVRVRTTGRDDPSGRFVAVSVPVADVVAHVRLPDSSAAIDPSAVTAQCDAVAVTPETPHDAWRSVPVRVSVNVPGFVPIEFVWRASDPPRGDVVLAPLPRR